MAVSDHEQLAKEERRRNVPSEAAMSPDRGGTPSAISAHEHLEEHRGPECRVIVRRRDAWPLPPGMNGAVIKWQCGVEGEKGANGVQVEDVIQACIDRVRALNVMPFACPENFAAISHLEEAQNWLDRRTRNRREQGVEGMNIPHRS